MPTPHSPATVISARFALLMAVVLTSLFISALAYTTWRVCTDPAVAYPADEPEVVSIHLHRGVK